MKKNNILRVVVLSVLIAAMVLCMFSCAEKKDDDAKKEISVTIAVTGKDGTTTETVVKAVAENLADILKASGFVEGEEGEYGFTVMTVKGETADFNTDGAYWSLLKDGEYLMTGASSTPVADGDHFELVYTVFQ